MDSTEERWPFVSTGPCADLAEIELKQLSGSCVWLERPRNFDLQCMDLLARPELLFCGSIYLVL